MAALVKGKVRSNDRLQEISAVAASLFRQKGYAETTTKEIAQACNISVGTLYYYIRSKKDFIKIFIDIHMNDIDGWEKKFERKLRTTSAEKVLRQAVGEFLYGVDRRKELVHFWFHTAQTVIQEDLERVFEIERRVGRVFEEIIREGCKRGEFCTSTPAIDAMGIQTLCQMWVLKGWFFAGVYALQEYADLCADMAVAIVKKKLPSSAIQALDSGCCL